MVKRPRNRDLFMVETLLQKFGTYQVLDLTKHLARGNLSNNATLQDGRPWKWKLFEAYIATESVRIGHGRKIPFGSGPHSEFNRQRPVKFCDFGVLTLDVWRTARFYPIF